MGIIQALLIEGAASASASANADAARVCVSSGETRRGGRCSCWDKGRGSEPVPGPCIPTEDRID